MLQYIYMQKQMKLHVFFMIDFKAKFVNDTQPNSTMIALKISSMLLLLFVITHNTHFPVALIS